MSGFGELNSGVQVRDDSISIPFSRSLSKDTLALEVVRSARQSLVNQSGDHELVKRFNELFTGLCHVAVERLDLDFVNPG